MDLSKFTGLIVALYTNRHDCGYDTSYHALYWDWTKMDVDSFCYGDTRGDMSQVSTVKVDASPEVKEAYNTSVMLKHYEVIVNTRIYETSQPNKLGMLCLVSKGRIAKGQIVTIKKLYRNDPYDRMLVMAQNGTVYEVYAKNLEVLFYPVDFTNFRPLVKPKYSKALLTLYKTA